MKTILQLYLLLLVSFSFAQTKKNTAEKEIPIKEKILMFNKNDSIKEALENQEEQLAKENQIHSEFTVDIRPEFPGGKEALRKYILDNLTIPKDKEFKGDLISYTIIIEKDGSLSEISVNERTLGLGIRKQVEDILKKSQKWIPAQVEGKAVRCKFFYFVKIDGNN
ncbi:hypothetical protein [Flavobacterium sangjuense]|uniref:TonB C-terminal domain-containing protein n=1 Tax=Flavobacterium sangjuense TaxID=2518177 RepID=A0A4P7PU32_9FLAO|nr:hypothetical protein [Flavobacterium sangjuense]QBZ97800.1 hypothetical protein GS03_01298 [Flavobacterium sangjuense]